MSEDELASIRAEVLAALRLSITHVRNSVLISDVHSKYELIWQSYSQAELAIGLAKLGFKDQIQSGLGSFRVLTNQKMKRASNMKTDVLKSNLEAAEADLERSLAEFLEGKATEALESARSGRDILKLLLLQEKRSRKPRKGRKIDRAS